MTIEILHAEERAEELSSKLHEVGSECGQHAESEGTKIFFVTSKPAVFGRKYTFEFSTFHRQTSDFSAIFNFLIRTFGSLDCKNFFSALTCQFHH